MATYHFRAYDRNGTETRGTIYASTDSEALAALQRTGRLPFELKAIGGGPASNRSLFRQGIDYRKLFSDLAVLVSARLPLDAAISILASTARSSLTRRSLELLVNDIQAGTPASSAFRKLPGLPESIAALFESAEGGGQIERIILRVAGYFEEQATAREGVLSAIAYPIFLIVALLIAVAIIFSSLVPAVAPLLESTTPAPLSTIGMLLFVHHIVQDYGVPFLFFAVAGLATLVASALTTPGRRKLTIVLLKLPLLGQVLRDRSIGLYLETLGMLLLNGVAMRRALALARSTCTLPGIPRLLMGIENGVVSGRSFSEAARESHLFDSTTMALITIGYEAGKLGETVERAAIMLRTRANLTLSRAIAVISPTLTIVSGGFIGALVLTIMSALMQMNDMALQ